MICRNDSSIYPFPSQSAPRPTYTVTSSPLLLQPALNVLTLGIPVAQSLASALEIWFYQFYYNSSLSALTEIPSAARMWNFFIPSWIESYLSSHPSPLSIPAVWLSPFFSWNEVGLVFSEQICSVPVWLFFLSWLIPMLYPLFSPLLLFLLAPSFLFQPASYICVFFSGIFTLVQIPLKPTRFVLIACAPRIELSSLLLICPSSAHTSEYQLLCDSFSI